MNPTKRILNHPQYHINDYNYLRTKGYTNKEILALWDRDHKEGHSPVTTNKYEIDWKEWNAERGYTAESIKEFF